MKALSFGAYRHFYKTKLRIKSTKLPRGDDQKSGQGRGRHADEDSSIERSQEHAFDVLAYVDLCI